MIISFSLKGLGPPSVGVWRIAIAAAGAATLGVALYRAPVWLDAWSAGAVVGAVVAAAAVLVLAIGVALRGSAPAITRIVVELVFLVLAVLAAEAILLARSPEEWSDDPLVQRMVVRERAAREHGIEFDARLPSEVVADLRSQGTPAVRGFAEGVIANPTVAKAIRDRALLPLSNAANATVVECNEGPGYLEFSSDQFGFNNPPELAAGPVDVAVIGESFALGHCVIPADSAVAQVRALFPHTANFGVAGSRVLSQLGVFREYVEPLQPRSVVWFVNVNFAEARHESDRPMLVRYLSDESFSQGLRQRQGEVDSFMREVLGPMHTQGDRALREDIRHSSSFPLYRVLKLRQVRDLVGFELAKRRPLETPRLDEFERAVDAVAQKTGSWGGRVIVVILPSYELSSGRPQDVARYEAVAGVLRGAAVTVVDGVALFAAEPDFASLYTLRIDNHPNERGHALIGRAVIAALNSKENP